MKLTAALVAMSLMQGAGTLGDHIEKDLGPLERMTLDQLIRISTMPPARISEMHCAALAVWLDQNQPRHAFALPAGEAARVATAVSAAIANDAELPADIARDFVAALTDEPGARINEASAAQRDGIIGDLSAPCKPLFSAANEGKPLPLHPLAKPSVVSPALATCYALYKAAASRADSEEAARLDRDADRAAELALRGKEGAERAAAEAVLAFEAAAALQAPTQELEAKMMRLVMCVPHLRGAAVPGAEKL